MVCTGPEQICALRLVLLGGMSVVPVHRVLSHSPAYCTKVPHGENYLCSPTFLQSGCCF